MSLPIYMCLFDIATAVGLSSTMDAASQNNVQNLHKDRYYEEKPLTVQSPVERRVSARTGNTSPCAFGTHVFHSQEEAEKYDKLARKPK